MKLSKPVLLAAMAAVFALGALWSAHGWLPNAAAQPNGGAAPAPDVTLAPPEAAGLSSGGVMNPVVSCTPQAYTTEMEEDPFDATKIRRTRTRVTSIVVVYADGTVKTQAVK